VINKLWMPLLVGYFVAAAIALAAIRVHRPIEALSPEQPIAFSHAIHAGGLGLECTHCHVYVAQSPSATVPAISICMECHESVLTDRPEIQKLTAYWEKKEPVLWNKIHDLPWHVRFTHEWHIKAGVDCSVCHGEIKAMDRVRRVRSLKMGWCVECHRSRSAPTDCTTCHK
jgi:hypothetical protein